MRASDRTTDEKPDVFHPRQITFTRNVYANQFLAAAQELGLEFSPLRDVKRTWLIRKDYKSVTVQAAILGLNRETARSLSVSKLLTHRNMRAGGIQMPEYAHFKVADPESTDSLVEDICAYARSRYPVVLKSVKGTASSGVLANIIDQADLIWSADHLLKQNTTEFIVEQYIDGRHYRINVFDGKLISAGCLAFPVVEGNGRSTIEELIDQSNAERKEQSMQTIALSERMFHLFEKSGVTPQTVLLAGQTQRLSEEVNRILGSAGSFRVELEKLPPVAVSYFQRIARQSGLRWMAIDFICDDIYDASAVLNGFVNEVNSAPAPAGFRQGITRSAYLKTAKTILRGYFDIG